MLLRQQFFDVCGYLGGLNSNALAIKVDVVFMVLGMTAHGCVQIFHGDSTRAHEIVCYRVACGDAIVGCNRKVL